MKLNKGLNILSWVLRLVVAVIREVPIIGSALFGSSA